MAKPNALGKGLGALLSESSIDTSNPLAKASSAAPAAVSNLPPEITVDDNGGLWINPALLKPNPKQPREEFNPKALEELADSIRENGVLQPIIIEHSDGNFYIIAGERRTRASKLANLSKVPVRLAKYDEFKKLEVALIENIQRENLNPIEEALGYFNMIQLGDLSQDEVAKRVGKNRSTVANALRLLKLPDDMQKSLAAGQISSGHARAILSVKTDADRRVLFGKIVGSGISVREAESLADTYNNGGRAAEKKTDGKKKTPKKDPDIEQFEQEMRNIFGVRGVNLKGSMDKGTLQIEYSSRNDLDRIYSVIIGNKD